MILFSSSNTILTSAKVLPGHVCQHTFQKAMALHNIVFTVVNNWLFPKLSGARNQVCESVRPKGGSRGPLNQNGCGAPGNSTQVVQVGLHKRPPENAPRGQNRQFYKGFGRILAFSPFRLSDAPRRPKRPPRSPQDGPRGLQEGPKTAQEGPKTAQEASKTAEDTSKTA